MKPYVPEGMTFTDACEKSKESFRKYRSRLNNEIFKAPQKSTSQPPSSRRLKLNFLFIIFIF